MPDNAGRLVLDDFSGGQNGTDPPLGPTFAPNQVTVASNVDWYRTKGCRRRNGSSNLSMTGSGFGSANVAWLARHVPSTDEANAELWAGDDGTPATIQRLDNSATWTSPASVTDTPAPAGTNLFDVSGASLNGLFFLSYESATARLHCYDSTLNVVRRTGINPGTTAPTAANTGAGTYAATLRYYRVRFAFTGVATTTTSEATPTVSFTPSGTGTGVIVTRPTTPSNEQITHWSVEGSSDNVIFYEISTGFTIAIATTTFTDSTNPSAYTSSKLAKATGTFTRQKSYRFIAADQNRLLGFGSWTAADKQARIEFSAVVGSLDICDAERVDTNVNYFVDLDENDSGVPTGLIGPVWGNFYAIKSRQIWELTPTGEVSRPYRVSAISKELGGVQGRSVCRGEDAAGNPCLYIMSHRGAYQYGIGGLHYIGRAIENLVLGPTSTINMGATKGISHILYHADKRQLWVWFAVGSANNPNTLCVYDVMTHGWANYTGPMSTARCSVMFATSIGATMGFPQVPYIGSSAAANRIVKCDDSTTTADSDSAGYQGIITTKPLQPWGVGFHGAVAQDVQLLAPTVSGVTLTATVTPDFGGTTKSGTVLLTAVGSETRTIAPNNRFQGTDLSDAEFVTITVGDGSAASVTNWSLDRITVPWTRAESVT